MDLKTIFGILKEWNEIKIVGIYTPLFVIHDFESSYTLTWKEIDDRTTLAATEKFENFKTRDEPFTNFLRSKYLNEINEYRSMFFTISNLNDILIQIPDSELPKPKRKTIVKFTSKNPFTDESINLDAPTSSSFYWSEFIKNIQKENYLLHPSSPVLIDFILTTVKYYRRLFYRIATIKECFEVGLIEESDYLLIDDKEQLIRVFNKNSEDNLQKNNLDSNLEMPQNYNSLRQQVDSMFDLIQLLCPNATQSDMDYIENNIEKVKGVFSKLENLNIFKSLESIHFSSNKQDCKSLLFTIEQGLEYNHQKWLNNYNEETFEKAKNEKLLYKSVELKQIILNTDSIIRNLVSEIDGFKKLYFSSSKTIPLVKVNLEETQINSNTSFEKETQRNKQAQEKEIQEKEKRSFQAISTPMFNKEKIEQICLLLNSYFPEQTDELKNLLTSNILPTQKLVFNSIGKSLLDFFKQLLDGRILIISQNDLEQWISKNFSFVHRNIIKSFDLKYCNSIISGTERAARPNRLIDVKEEKGQMVIVPLKKGPREQK